MEHLKSYFPVLALFGSVGLLWGNIRSVFGRIYGLVFNNVKLEGYGASVINTYIWNNWRGVDSGSYRYYSSDLFIKGFTSKIMVGSKKISEKYQLFLLGWTPLLIKKDKGECVFIVFIRGTLNFDELFQDALDYWNKLIVSNENRFRVITLTGRSQKSFTIDSSLLKEGSAPPISSNNGLSVSHDIMHWFEGRIMKYKLSDIGKDYESLRKSYVFDDQTQEIFNEIQKWHDLKQWYKDRGLIWKRGYLLSSGPGCGKTSFVRIVGTKLNMPIFRFDLGSMTNQDFIEKWQSITQETPCIALFEDIDAIWNGRENVSGLENGISFDCFLNALSGALPADGVLIFVTTNRIGNIDEALASFDISGNASRPGRIDRIVELKNLSFKLKEKLAAQILDNNFNLVDSVMVGSEGLSNAQFTEKCLQAALNSVWNKN